MPAKNTAWFGQNLTSHTQLARWANRQQTLRNQSHSMSKCSKADSNGSGTQPPHTTHTTLTNGCSLAGQTRAQVRPARLAKITIRSLLPAEWRAISLLHNLGLGSSPSAQSPPTWLAPLVNNTDTTSHSQFLFCSFAFQTDREVAHSHARAKLPHTLDTANYLFAYLKWYDCPREDTDGKEYMNKNISVVQLSTHQQTNMFKWTMSFVVGAKTFSAFHTHHSPSSCL